MARGTNMQRAGVNKKMQKGKILVMLSVKRVLSKLGYLAKMDSFYLTCRIFTEAGYELFLHEVYRHFAEATSAQRNQARLTKAVTSSKIVESKVDVGPGATGEAGATGAVYEDWKALEEK